MKATEKNELTNTMNTTLKTIGDLKKAKYVSKSIKTELRDNLIHALQAGKKTFQGMHGYEQTVIPQLERAILSKHNINLLGLRGQGKTRIARLMIQLLDEYIPLVDMRKILFVKKEMQHRLNGFIEMIVFLKSWPLLMLQLPTLLAILILLKQQI